MTEAASPALGVARSLSGRRWIWRAAPGDGLERAGLGIAQRLGVPEIVGRLLAGRGIDISQAADFLEPTLRALMPDPDVLADMPAAAARLADAIERAETVAALAELHALSESLDTTMASQLGAAVVTPLEYIRIWQATGRAAERAAQIDLTLNVASRLDRFTRKPLLRNSLRLMRGPARAAGMAELQHFLEAGFDTFRAMRGAEEFISIVQSREQALASTLFAADLGARQPDPSAARALANLPPGIA